MMEAWSCVSENKGFVSNDSVGSEKSSLLGWELKRPSSFGNNFVVSNVEGIEKQRFGEFGLPETIREHWDVSSSVTVANSNSGVVSNKRFYTTIAPSSVSFYSGDEPISRPSSSVVVESSNRDLALIDLKLGILSDCKDSLNFRSSKVGPIGSSVGSSQTPAKRGRASLSCQGVFCQVHGCKKDLSSSKDYHKRHKVCEIHSKTAKVIVNGIEQRFCQQCSRFHLLGEFDDGKRSCRKRLAGHNERRRKPQVGNHAGRAGRLFHSYLDSTGSRFQGSTITTSSVISQDPTDLMYPFKHSSNDWNRRNNHKEGGSFCRSQSEITITNRYHNPKSIFSQSFDKNILPFRVNRANSSPGMGDLSEITTQNIYENFFVSKSASAALSLLSSQSRNSSSHSPGTLVSQPSINGLSNKFIGPTGLFSCQEGNNSINDSINYGDGMFQGSAYISNSKRGICGADMGTIDLIQLSTQLQRVEHERQYTKINQDDVIGGMKIT